MTLYFSIWSIIGLLIVWYIIKVDGVADHPVIIRILLGILAAPILIIIIVFAYFLAFFQLIKEQYKEYHTKIYKIRVGPSHLIFIKLSKNSNKNYSNFACFYTKYKIIGTLDEISHDFIFRRFRCTKKGLLNYLKEDYKMNIKKNYLILQNMRYEDY